MTDAEYAHTELHEHRFGIADNSSWFFIFDNCPNKFRDRLWEILTERFPLDEHTVQGDIDYFPREGDDEGYTRTLNLGGQVSYDEAAYSLGTAIFSAQGVVIMPVAPLAPMGFGLDKHFQPFDGAAPQIFALGELPKLELVELLPTRPREVSHFPKKAWPMGFIVETTLPYYAGDADVKCRFVVTGPRDSGRIDRWVSLRGDFEPVFSAGVDRYQTDQSGWRLSEQDRLILEVAVRAFVKNLESTE
jgi:hypothetical protein